MKRILYVRKKISYVIIFKKLRLLNISHSNDTEKKMECKRTKVEREIWIVMQHNFFYNYDAAPLDQKFFLSEEEAKNALEEHCKERSTAVGRDGLISKQLSLKQVRQDTKGIIWEESNAVDEFRKYKKFREKVLNESKYPWTDIFQYYALKINWALEGTDIPYMEILKLSR